MVKIKAQREDYEQLIAEAAVIMGGWMSYFPAPDCREQDEVVKATIEWLKNAKQTVE
jgi:regulator of RNase E activity RraB